MNDYHPDCCPILRYAAEAEALVHFGLEVSSYSAPAAIAIGRLRQLHGCPGPATRWGTWSCPWLNSGALGSTSVVINQDVPRVTRKSEDGRKTPGAML